MRISETGPSATNSAGRRFGLRSAQLRRAGFSLVEILVVLFVVVLLTSLVSLNLDAGGAERELRQRVDALLAIAGLALDEAAQSGSDFGVLFVRERNEDGDAVTRARWRQRQQPGWRRPRDELGLFRDIEFPAGVDLRLSLDSTAVSLFDARDGDEQTGRTPQWLLTASGETQTGELLLVERQSGDVLWRVTWDALGRFEVFRGERLETEQEYIDAL
ncbi:MAG: prepilin-type N-terminal cleavage/methylation domain-containing protein [Halieaceae bacterium]|jgi:prepilin-type N-terminal cleavage/methylation domain-containing protein|nr:prepilin-type N-terminal cleavage/methylation domain-containing protein [Halieaceae bacterium]